MDRRLLIAGGGAALASLTAYVAFRTPSPEIAQESALPADVPAASTSDASVDISQIKEMSLGNPDAALTFIEYASFTCPHCAAFHMGPFKQLKADFIDTGKIKFVNREVFFDRFGLWAAIVARCGDGNADRYFGIADLLYERQSQWAGRGNSPAQIVAQLRTIGKTAGLTDAQLDSCFADEENAKALVAYYEKNSQADHINSTPSFVIDGQKYSNMAYARLKATIESKLPS